MAPRSRAGIPRLFQLKDGLPAIPRDHVLVPTMRLRFSRRGLILFLIISGVVFIGFLGTHQGRTFVGTALGKIRGGHTIEDRVASLGPAVERRLVPLFEQACLPYPPCEVAYVVFKDERTLEVYGRAEAEAGWRFVKAYAVLGMSGRTGPKLTEGDRQVPEGLYQSDFLNANSRHHLSIRLNYPNDDDRKQAERDGRKKLGGDIMIHGGTASIGCLAMGDAAAEDLFILAALAREKQTQIIVSPSDFRRKTMELDATTPLWIIELYRAIATELKQFPQPK